MPTVNSLTLTPYTALYTTTVAGVTAAVSTQQGRQEIVLDLNSGLGAFARDFETLFSWPISSGTIIYTWQPTLLELPEDTYNRVTDWIEIGGANGLVQGIIVEADTFNVTKVFQLQDSDTLALHALNEVGTGVAFNQQSVKAFSCVTPFVAHSVRVVTSDGVPWRVWRTQPVFVPFPEKASNWTTEITALGGIGWQHLRELNVEYISTATITLAFTVDTGNGSIAPISITLPSSSGTQTKKKFEVTYNKWKLLGLAATSASPFNLFVEGFQGKLKAWGSTESYRIGQLIGGPSSGGAEV